MKTNYRKAFSLVELSIVILIISVIVTGSLGISKSITDSDKKDLTKERMDAVYKAITHFVAINKRIPCPASLEVAKGTDNYGDEPNLVDPSLSTSCNGTFKSSTNAANLAWGMVPVLDLGLDPEMAEDGFGTKFSYVVDRRFTYPSISTSSTNGFEITKSAPSQADTTPIDLGGINPQAPAGTSLLENQNAIFVLISHGANKYNGYPAVATSMNAASGVSDENNNSCSENGSCSTSGTTSYNRAFVVNSSNPNFDDIVLFKTKTQVAMDAGLEFIMCNQSEAATGASTSPCTSKSWNRNGYYGGKVLSTDNSCFRACEKYGSWGTATSLPSTSGISVNKSLDYRTGSANASITGDLFTYNGGRLLVLCVISASHTAATTNLEMWFHVRNSGNTTNIYTLGTVRLSQSIPINVHTSLVKRSFVVEPGTLIPGTQYRIRMERGAGNVDSSDYMDAAVIEFPLHLSN